MSNQVPDQKTEPTPEQAAGLQAFDDLVMRSLQELHIPDRHMDAAKKAVARIATVMMDELMGLGIDITEKNRNWISAIMITSLSALEISMNFVEAAQENDGKQARSAAVEVIKRVIEKVDCKNPNCPVHGLKKPDAKCVN